MIPVPDRMNPELLGDPWESYDNQGNVVLDLDKLTFKLTDPNMIVVMFTDPGRLWAACSTRDEEDAVFLSQPYWLNTRDGNAGNLGDSNDTDRFFDDSDSIFDKKFADNQSYRVENFGITMNNEPCELVDLILNVFQKISNV